MDFYMFLQQINILDSHYVNLQHFPCKLCGPFQNAKDPCRPTTEQTEQKTKTDREMREVHYGQQRSPKLVCGMNNAFVFSILPILYVCKMTVITVESGRDDMKGEIKMAGRVSKGTPEGREDISVSCQILS